LRGGNPLTANNSINGGFEMSEKMIAVARAFANKEKCTFPIMTAKELGYFLKEIKEQRLKKVH
ncbi:TPA: hypothetical protein I7721_21135, partial [Vibrio vulnificus]|nr:hypothetical protein [Vibrio vulnificus]